MNILHVAPQDVGGGAERVALQLVERLAQRGLPARLAVGRRLLTPAESPPFIFEIPNDQARPWWNRQWMALARRFPPPLRTVLERLGRPGRVARRLLGWHEFDFPATQALANGLDILHLHNLHGDYFDLRVLPTLCRQTRVFLTLHDAWLFTGHCAHFFGCERFRIGCGRCPDLSIPPALRRDGTAHNWRVKRRVFAACGPRLFVSAPSKWLLDIATGPGSILSPAVREARVIPNGVDRTVFTPQNKAVARQRLGLPPCVPMALFAANGIRQNPFKDWQTLRAALAMLPPSSEPRLFVALGDSGPPETVGAIRVQFVPFVGDMHQVADYYRAADVYVHAARADTFPTSVIEALACGTPVVATGIGGIPEQVRSSPDVAPTGVLVPAGNPARLANELARVLSDVGWREALGRNAAADAARRFDVESQVASLLSWYGESVQACRPSP